MKNFKLLLLMVIISLVFVSCKKDDTTKPQSSTPITIETKYYRFGAKQCNIADTITVYIVNGIKTISDPYGSIDTNPTTGKPVYYRLETPTFYKDDYYQFPYINNGTVSITDTRLYLTFHNKVKNNPAQYCDCYNVEYRRV